MNERIRELAEQTGYIWHASGDPQIYEFTPEKLEKFAELIVRKCMSIIKQGDGLGNEDDFDKGFQAGIAMAYNRIRAQMGVEE